MFSWNRLTKTPEEKLPKTLDEGLTKTPHEKLIEFLEKNLRNDTTSLSLEGNLIGAEGAIGLADALKTNSSITSLDLGYNQIGDAGANEIGKYIQRNKNLAEKKAETLNAQGDSFCKDGKYDKAIEKYNEAIAINKKPLYVTNKTNAEKNLAEDVFEKIAYEINLKIANNATINAKDKSIMEDTIKDIINKAQLLNNTTAIEKITTNMQKLIVDKPTKLQLMTIEDQIDKLLEPQNINDDVTILGVDSTI